MKMQEPAAVIAISLAGGYFESMQLFAEERIEVTDECIEAEIVKSAYPVAPVSWRRISLSDLPDEHYDLRNAWTDDGGKIAVDMAKAKELTRDRLRRERKPLLEALDIQAMRALEVGDVTSLGEIAEDKKRLRDITDLPEIDAAKTPEDLKAITIGGK